jgi:hypothetical protein
MIILMRTHLAVVALVALLFAPVLASAHPGHEHKIMGTLAAVDGQRLLVKTTDGKELSVEVTAMTKVLRGKIKSDARDLKVGMRVVVNVADGKEPLKAKEIQYSEATTTQKSR